MASDDPWMWTVDDLVDQICESTHLFTATGHEIPSVSDLSALATELRNKRITGTTFMTTLDAHVPRHIGAMATTSIVNLLQSRSPSYQQHTATASVESLTIGSAQSRPPPSSSDINELTVVDDSGRKRRKVVHLYTEPLPVRPTEEQDSDLPRIAQQDTASHGGMYDHLKRWEQVEDVEDDDDDVYDAVDELKDDEEVFVEVEDEDPVDIQRPPARTGKLSTNDVIDIINERIGFYTAQWRPGKGRAADEPTPDPESLWLDAENEGRRQEFEDANNANVEFFRDRLDRIGEEILQSPWNIADHVQKVCASLETTVDLLEEAEWLASIYKLPPENESSISGDGEENVNRSIGDNEEGSRGDPMPEDLTNLHRSRAIDVIDLGSGSDTSELEYERRDDVGSMSHVDNTTTEALQEVSSNSPAVPPSSRTTESKSIALRGAPAEEEVPVSSAASAQGLAIYDDAPELSSIYSVSRWKWDDLVAKADRKRIVMKVLQEMDTPERGMLRTRFNNVRKRNLLMEIPACVRMWLRSETKLPGVLPQDLAKIVAFTKLFLSWWMAGNCFRQDIREHQLEELASCLDAGCDDPGIFYDWVRHIFANTFSEEAWRIPQAPSQTEYIVISDDDDTPPVPKKAQRRRVSMLPATGAFDPEVVVLD